MVKVNVDLEVDDGFFEENTSITEKVKRSFNSDGINVNEVSVEKEDEHKIHGFSDAHCVLYYHLSGSNGLEPDHVKMAENEPENIEFFEEIAENSWLHCTCGELSNASEEVAIEHLQEHN